MIHRHNSSASRSADETEFIMKGEIQCKRTTKGCQWEVASGNTAGRATGQLRNVRGDSVLPELLFVV